jgi:GNAT superfamily N-acetyltransferase
MNQNSLTTTLEIIPCDNTDAEKLSAIAIRSYKDFYLYLWHDDGTWYIDHSFAPSVLEKELNNRNHAFFLLNEKGVPAGFLKLNIDQPLKGYEQYNCIELERIYFIRSATGKGYGRQVMEFCFDYSRKLKKDIIWLKAMAMDSSDAILFYKKSGFEICGSHSLDFPQMKQEFRGMSILMKRLQ